MKDTYERYYKEHRTTAAMAVPSLNTAWQQYVYSFKQETGKLPEIPEDYPKTYELLFKNKYIEVAHPSAGIVFIKGPTAEECYFKVEEPTTQPH